MKLIDTKLNWKYLLLNLLSVEYISITNLLENFIFTLLKILKKQFRWSWLFIVNVYTSTPPHTYIEYQYACMHALAAHVCGTEWNLRSIKDVCHFRTASSKCIFLKYTHTHTYSHKSCSTRYISKILNWIAGCSTFVYTCVL